MATLFEIDKAAQEYSQAHDGLAEIMTAIDDAVTRIKRERMPTLRKAVEKAAAKKTALRGLIDESRDQFKSPRTRILHGVKLGLQKGKGKLDWEDDELVVKLIKKHFPEETWEMLIKKTEKPRKDGLNGLDVKDLRKIGVTAEDTGDQIVVKPTDSEIDKMVDALLGDEDPEAA